MKKIIILILFVFTLAGVAVAGEFLVPANGASTLSMQYETVCAASNCYYVVDEATAQSLVATGAADSYEENPIRYIQSAGRDTYLDDSEDQWDLIDTNINWGGGVELMMTVPDGSSRPIAAVIDTGITEHEDLQGAIYASAYVDTSAIDMVGHGTHVAGIIAADTGNGIGVASASYGKGQVLPIKTARGGLSTFRASDLISAIGMVLNFKAQGVPILAVNMSLGGYTSSEAENKAFKSLSDAGIIVVAAAGNEEYNIGVTPIYPAEYNFNNIITVTALDEGLNLANYANYGGTTAIAAPGSNILSTVGTDEYAYKSGTSMATPFITGVLLAGKALNPDLTPAQLVNILYSSAASDVRLLGMVKGSRRIDVGAFLEQVDACRDGCTVPIFFPTKGGNDYIPPAENDDEGSDNSGIFGCAMSNGGGWDMLWLLLPAAILIRARWIVGAGSARPSLWRRYDKRVD